MKLRSQWQSVIKRGLYLLVQRPTHKREHKKHNFMSFEGFPVV